jgi:hypothetical protein
LQLESVSVWGGGGVKRFLDSREGANCSTEFPDIGGRLQTFLDSGKGDSHSWMSGRRGNHSIFLEGGEGTLKKRKYAKIFKHM